MPASPAPQPRKEHPPEPAADGHAALILSLMSHYLCRPCPLLIRAIAGRLSCLSQACGGRSAEALIRLADALLPQWRDIADVARH